MGKGRAYYITKSQHVMLNNWGDHLITLFNGHVAFHVGSSLTTKDWFDVDVRMMLPDDEYEALSKVIKISELDAIISQWGQRVTDLPIDFQIQDMTKTNEEFKGTRNAMMR